MLSAKFSINVANVQIAKASWEASLASTINNDQEVSQALRHFSCSCGFVCYM